MPRIEHITLYRIQVFGKRGLKGSFLAAAHDEQQARWIGEEWARKTAGLDYAANARPYEQIKVTKRDRVAVVVT